MPAYTHLRQVAFSETDAGGIVHFSRIFPWLEDAEHALLASLGHGVHGHDELGERMFPRVHAELDFARPFAFPEAVHVDVWIARRGQSSITWDFVVSGADGVPRAKGRTVVVFARRGAQGLGLVKQALPPDLVDALDALAAACTDTPPELR